MIQMTGMTGMSAVCVCRVKGGSLFSNPAGFCLGVVPIREEVYNNTRDVDNIKTSMCALALTRRDFQRTSISLQPIMARRDHAQKPFLSPRPRYRHRARPSAVHFHHDIQGLRWPTVVCARTQRGASTRNEAGWP